MNFALAREGRWVKGGVDVDLARAGWGVEVGGQTVRVRGLVSSSACLTEHQQAAGRKPAVHPRLVLVGVSDGARVLPPRDICHRRCLGKRLQR